MEHSDGIKISAKTRSSCLFCKVDAVLIPETCYSTPTQACLPPTRHTVGTSIPNPYFYQTHPSVYQTSDRWQAAGQNEHWLRCHPAVWSCLPACLRGDFWLHCFREQTGLFDDQTPSDCSGMLTNNKREISLGLTRTMRKEVRRRIDGISENHGQDTLHRASVGACQFQGKMSYQWYHWIK